jgi:signal transduction histidine kinase
VFRPLKPYQITVDAVAAAIFALIAIAVLGPVFPGQGLWWALGPVVTIILMSAALGVRRLSPGLALALAWAGAFAQMLTGGQPGFVDIAIFGVLYTTAAYGSRLVFWLGFASAIVGAAVITVYLFGAQLAFSGGWQMIPTAVAILFAALFALMLSWTVGALSRTAIRARATRVAQQRAEAQTVAEQERVRIARDMHDVVAHSLAVVIAQADGARYAAATDPEAANAALGTISSTARSALADVRLLLTQLRHRQGDGPQPTLADLEVLYAHVRSAGVDLRIDVDPVPRGEPPAAVQLAVYRILQEALTNAMRHGAAPVSVTLAWHADRVDLEVANPLRPTGEQEDRIERDDRRGHGIIGMRERAQLAGGRLDAGADDGRFVVRATIPMGGIGR